MQGEDATDDDEVDAFVIVYSVTDALSFAHAMRLLKSLKDKRMVQTAVILVANKEDLVRGRLISTDGKG